MRVVAAGLCAWTAWVWAQGSIYEVPEVAGEVVGAWDVNILADDVEFEVASIIRMVRLRLAIAGEQDCRVWIFDSLNAPPLHVQAFTNVPATNQFDVSTYDIELRVQVPREVYIGFSAQGDGWGETDSDFWSRGNVVNRGVEGTRGQYYYGPVAGGQLTTMYAADIVSYGCIQILSEPVRIEGVETGAVEIHLTIDSLPVHASNRVMRSTSAAGSAWEERGELPAGVESANWSESLAGGTSAFYRIESW